MYDDCGALDSSVIVLRQENENLRSQLVEKDKEIAARKDIDDSLQKKIKRLDQELAPLRERTKGIEEEYSGKIDVTEETRQAVCESVAEALGDAYDCIRAWSAWEYGTMRRDDFSLVAEDDSRVAEIAEAAIKVLIASLSIKGKVKDYDNLDFGDKNFTITFPSMPIEFFVNKTFICPACGYEAEHSTNAEGEPKNKPFCPECFRKANIPLMEVKK